LQRRIFGLVRDEVVRGLTRVDNEELANLYSLPDVIRFIKLRRLRWAGYLACMEERGA
jgi:hypothetical protein